MRTRLAFAFSCFPRHHTVLCPVTVGLGAIKARMVRAWKVKGENNAINHLTGTERTYRRRFAGAVQYGFKGTGPY